MLYERTKAFLMERFDPENTQTPFTDRHTEELYQILLDGHSEKEVVERRDEIRKAFSDFYRDVGNAVVLFRGMDKIALKVAPYRKSPAESRYLLPLVQAIRDGEEWITNAEGRQDVVVFETELAQQLNHILAGSDEPINKREVVKYAIRHAMGYTEKDALVFLKGKIVVRLFKEPTFPGASGSKEEEDGRERRYNGLPKEELERLKHEVFQDSVTRYFMEITDHLMEGTLDFTRVSNEWFEANYLKEIQRGLFDYLARKLEEEQMVVEGFGNYLLRENFALVHRMLATRLVELAVARNSNAETFLSYYTGDVRVIGGAKYRLPEITDANGHRWNAVTLRSIAQQRKKDLEALEKKRQEVAALKKDHGELEQEAQATVGEEKKWEDELLRLKVEVSENGKKLETLREELAARRRELNRAKDTMKPGIQQEINRISSEIKKATRRDETLFKERSKAEVRYNEAKTKAGTAERKNSNHAKKIAEEERKTEYLVRNQQEVAEKYDVIVDAVSKALAKKKVKL